MNSHFLYDFSIFFFLYSRYSLAKIDKKKKKKKEEKDKRNNSYLVVLSVFVQVVYPYTFSSCVLLDIYITTKKKQEKKCLVF